MLDMHYGVLNEFAERSAAGPSSSYAVLSIHGFHETDRKWIKGNPPGPRPGFKRKAVTKTQSQLNKASWEKIKADPVKLARRRAQRAASAKRRYHAD